MNEHFKLPLTIFSLFILFTIIGTLSHELGHIVAARALGYETELFYSSMTYWKTPEILELRNTCCSEVESLFIQLAGPIQTLSFGTIGLMLLIRYNNQNPKRFWNGQTLGIMLSMFWLRPIFNVLIFVFVHQENFSNDEIRIAEIIGASKYSILWTEGILAFTIFLLIFPIFIPKQLVRPLIIFGVLGSVSGYILWFKILGPIFLS